MTANTLKAFHMLEALGPQGRAELLAAVEVEQARRRAEAQLAREVSPVLNRLAGVARRMTGDAFSQAWG